MNKMECIFFSDYDTILLRLWQIRQEERNV